MTVRVLMVCMGNICRSPTAEAVLRHKLAHAGLASEVEVASAGTHAWHRGEPPDRRSIAHAERRGYDLKPLRAKSLSDVGWLAFDLVLAMDDDNLTHLHHKLQPVPSDGVPPEVCLLSSHRLRLSAREVPDPYYSGPEGFEHVLDVVEDACDGVLLHLQKRLQGCP